VIKVFAAPVSFMKNEVLSILKLTQASGIATPVFVYDHALLFQQISLLREVCGDITDLYSIAYSYKTNPLLAWRSNTKALEKLIMGWPADIPLHTLNLGGGYPIPYLNATQLSVRKIFSHVFTPSLKKILQRFPDLHLVIEPGRFLVGPAGFLVATVTNLQSSKELHGAVVDASLFATFADRFLSKMTFQPPVYARHGGKKKYFIRGSSPASVDHFGVYVNLPELHVGDTLVCGMMGAYASSMGSMFSGVTKPNEYLLREERLVRLASSL